MHPIQFSASFTPFSAGSFTFKGQRPSFPSQLFSRGDLPFSSSSHPCLASSVLLSFVSPGMNSALSPSPSGPSINDVTLWTGEGGSQKVTNSTDRLHECVTKGGGGPKSRKISVTSFMDGPFLPSSISAKWGRRRSVAVPTHSALLEIFARKRHSGDPLGSRCLGGIHMLRFSLAL